MRQVRKLTLSEAEESITLSANAYPGLELANRANRARYRERLAQLGMDPTTHFYGLFEDGQMRGTMRWHDFTMNFFGTQMLVGGLGGLAVDLLHKKEKVAAEMVGAFLRHYKEAGVSMTALYPFRPDFYRRMGFGYGTPMHHYRFAPSGLLKGPTKSDLVFLDKEDSERLHDCYNRYFQRTHGIMARQPQIWEGVLGDPTRQVVGVSRGDRLTGYLSFSFEKGRHDNFLSNTIHIGEMVYETAEDLGQLLSFLHTQVDQIEAISYNTQDDSFYYLLQDPRMDAGAVLPDTVAHESSTQGLGIMYRVLDVLRLFELLEDHNFGGVTCRLQIDISDSFFPENAGSYGVEFIDGQVAQLTETALQQGSGQEFGGLSQDGTRSPYVPEVVLALDVAEFSSLVIGAVSLRKLVAYGLATLSDDVYLSRLDHLFRGPMPICQTSF